MWGQALAQAWWCDRCEVGETRPAADPPPTCFICAAELDRRPIGWDPTRTNEPV